MMRVLKHIVVCVMLASGVCGAAERDATKAKPPKGKKPNVTALMKPADDLIAEAEDAYAEEDLKKAIDLYRQALGELLEVEMENEAWVATSEFAPVSNRKLGCEKRIDDIMLEEAQKFTRTMTLTDTRDLEKKRAERRKAAENAPEIAPLKLGVKGSNTGRTEEVEVEPLEPFEIEEELDLAKDKILDEDFAEAERALVKVLRAASENREARFLMALARVRQGRSSDALVMLDDLLADDVADESVLLLAAGAYMATGAYGKALNALDQMTKINPRRPDTCINMAWLLLEMRPDGIAEAEQYYRLAVKMGAARIRELEQRLGIKQE
ncbi:MAG: hypothetical protein FWH21_08195 [Kiritimatiellaeota bacterium]|nr:hypothetical protein [Kiritimatiellota bacterium]